MAEIRLGKNQRTVNTDNIKGGIRRDDLKNDVQKKIFDALNVNSQGQQDDVLDAQEINNVIGYLIDLSGDDLKLGKRDAKKFFKDLNLENLKQEDLFNFIEQLAASHGDIVQSTVQKLDGKRVVLITRENEQPNNDGTHQLITTEEQINSDGTSQTNVTTTTDYNIDGKMTGSESVMHGGEIITRSYLDDTGEVVLDSDGNEVLQKETITSGNSTTVVEYDAKGNEFYKTVTYGGDDTLREEYDYLDINGQRVPKLASKIVGSRTTYYTYDNAGRITREYSSGETITESFYKYNDDGTLASSTKLDGDKLTMVKYSSSGDGNYMVTEAEGAKLDSEDLSNPQFSFSKRRTITTYNAQNHALNQEIKVAGGENYKIS